MSVMRTILKNSMSNAVLFVVEAVVGFLMLPFVVHRIGDSAYGMWVIIIAVTGYMSIFKLGLRPAINKYVSQYKALKQYEKMRDFVGVTLTIYFICAVITLLISIIIFFLAEYVLNIPDQYAEITKYMILCVGLQSAFGFLYTVYGGVISGYQRYEINAGIEICVILIRTSIIVAFLPKYPNLYLLAAAHFSITISGYIVTVIVARKIAPVRGLKVFRKPPKDAMESIVKFTSISIAIGILGTIITYADSFIVGALLTASAITHYSVGGRLLKYSENLIKVTTRVVAPATSALEAQNEMGTVQKIMEYSSKISFIITFPVLTCLAIQGMEFILLWMGPGYENSYKVMLILAVSGILFIPQQGINSILYGLAKHRFMLYLQLTEGLISIPLSFFLGIKYGVEGIAIGLSVPRAILRGFVFPILVARMIGLKSGKIFIDGYLRTVIGAIPYIVCLYYSRIYFDLSSWVMFFSQLFICLILYIVPVWLVSLTKIEKRMITEGVESTLPFLGCLRS